MMMILDLKVGPIATTAVVAIEEVWKVAAESLRFDWKWAPNKCCHSSPTPTTLSTAGTFDHHYFETAIASRPPNNFATLGRGFRVSIAMQMIVLLDMPIVLSRMDLLLSSKIMMKIAVRAFQGS